MALECQTLRVATLEQANKDIVLEIKRSFAEMADAVQAQAEDIKKIRIQNEKSKQKNTSAEKQMNEFKTKHVKEMLELRIQKQDVIPRAHRGEFN